MPQQKPKPTKKKPIRKKAKRKVEKRKITREQFHKLVRKSAQPIKKQKKHK
jgi:hypothetical protein